MAFLDRKMTALGTKISETLLFYVIHMISKNDKNSSYFALVVLFQKKMGFLKLFSFFKLNLSFEDDVIKKFDMTFRCDTFYVDSKVLIAFVLAREEC